MDPSPRIHLAIIPDGNRRWAKAQGKHPWKGHEQAIENFRTITEWCRKDPRVAALTVWCFSTENWKRDPEEISQLMTMLEKYLAKERRGFMKEKTRFLHSGRRDRIPASLAKLIASVEEETKDQSEFTLHLAVDYGGKDEILRAMHRLSNQESATRNSPAITEESLRQSLDHPELPDIDLIIRTSGEKRTSNFFLWQTAYAEWIFSEKLFPDFTEKDVEAAVTELDQRKRRYGA
ncbi:di-trans,poly-cis-decaprenylcistransferase [Candidatus Peribacteria bacterium RIFCSPHIGHO2_01_FULL_55_13]|nr:MAG: di-trans,poly-cis-decaprenylcistransferase [Candidatus Peribacteria bacterium RIFCSPHIGHO2_01_FULL_55_13]OGJ64394.1 MAG: di-trans,poly-cis-decaprenylcistransferase [Candidatus Peribacteria bacterium RIFCSPHIGHO2_12_FULL_55_11]